jgi:hypothetical protein
VDPKNAEARKGARKGARKEVRKEAIKHKKIVSF